MSIWARIIYANQYAGAPPDHLNTYGDVYIEMFDTLTNLPVNGDYRIVSYTITDLSGSTSSSITIAGQTALIYSGLINRPSPLYNLLITIDDVSDGVEVGLPCDLLILNVNIDNPQSNDGANDGQITINAISSTGPIEYSLDNSTWQTSPIFFLLAGGAYTAYARCPTECTAELNFFLPTTKDLLISDPSVTVAGNISRWNAAHNPIRFTYQRKDFEVLSTAEMSGHVLVSANVDTTQLTVGEYVYLNSEGYDFTAKVLSTLLFEGAYLVELDYPYVSDTTGGFLNINSLVKYYEIETFVTFIDLETGNLTTSTSRNTPNSKGLVVADLHALLKSALSTDDSSSYNVINYRDLNQAASYTISFREVWEGYTGQTVEIETPFYVTFAARQLGQLYGGNMLEFVPFVSPLRPAKFLTDFEEPVYSEGFPFDISFIYSEWLLGQPVKFFGQFLDINRNSIGEIINNFLLNEDSGFLLTQDSGRFIITTETVNPEGQSLPERLGVNRLLINNAVIPNAYYLKIWLAINGSLITEEKVIRIDQNCNDPYFYMRWIGLTGTWNYFKFSYNASVSLDVQNMSMVKNFVEDWANDKSIEKVINKNAGKKITVEVEDLDKSLIEGLQSIKHSCEVQFLYQANPMKWQTVVLNTAIFQEFETRYNAYNFSITFNLPSINTNSQ
jgi:hypothetical protein